MGLKYKITSLSVPGSIVTNCMSEDVSENFFESFSTLMPRRWFRMDVMSRLAVASVGFLLHLLGEDLSESGKTVTGFVVATHTGSLSTDLAFLDTLKDSERGPSPLLFSYTLPNIAPSEAAAHFNLRGPVYAIFSSDELWKSACNEAERLLRFMPGTDRMIVAVLELPPQGTPHVEIGMMTLQETDVHSRA